MSYLITSVSEQQQQFGIMRALGTKPKNVLKIVVYQAAMIIAVSVAIGVPAGIYIAFNFLIPNPILSQSTLIVVVIGISAIFGILCISSVYPTLKTINQTITKTLSNS
jgi:putative ABC transport system permease protein